MLEGKPITITGKTRKKFRAWSSAVHKLDEQTKQKEAAAWIDSALTILEQNEQAPVPSEGIS